MPKTMRRGSAGVNSDAPSVSQTTGAGAVALSKRAREQQEAVTVTTDASPEIVRTVGGKVFYLRDGVWTDAEYKSERALPEVRLRFASEEYFTLIRREPELAKFFSLGEDVVVIFKERVYHVTADTR
jgi:hypothetical protein